MYVQINNTYTPRSTVLDTQAKQVEIYDWHMRVVLILPP